MHAVTMNGMSYLIPDEQQVEAARVIAEKWARSKGVELLGHKLLSFAIVLAGFKYTYNEGVKVVADVIPLSWVATLDEELKGGMSHGQEKD